jgi:hypothetical protein
VEVKGLEPSATTLRMYGSRCFDQGLSEVFPGRCDPLRFPHDPSPSLSIRSRKVTFERSRRVATDRHLLPIGRLSQCRANRPVAAFATITLPGERQEIFGSDAGVLVAGQTTERRCSVRHPPIDNACRITPTKSPARTWCLQLCPVGTGRLGQCRGGSTLPWFGNEDSRSTTLA